MSRTRHPFRRTWFAALLTALAVVSTTSKAQAQIFTSAEKVTDWDPIFFEFACGTRSGDDRPEPRDISCLGDPWREWAEDGSTLAMLWYHELGVRSPDTLGPVIDSYDFDDWKAVRIFSKDEPWDADLTFLERFGYEPGKRSTAAASMGPRECDKPFLSAYTLVTWTMKGEGKLWFPWVGAHELYHAVDQAGPTAVRCGRYDWYDPGKTKWYKPNWISEAIPEAFSIQFLEDEDFFFFPVSGVGRYDKRLVGMRAYYFPINFNFKNSGSNGDYNTSSFWNFLVNRFHKGNPRFLEKWLDTEAPVVNGKEDWLKWLDERLIDDKAINAPFYLVYSSFLTDFAGQWDTGGIGEGIGEQAWMLDAFQGCYTVVLTPIRTYKEIPVKINNLSGLCIEVRVAGFGPDDLLSVKIGALTEDQVLADSLNLGFAYTTDATGFNCATAAREGRIFEGIIGCLLEPVTGTFEKGRGKIKAARMWNASSLEYGPGGQMGGALGTSIHNTYVLTRVPPEPIVEHNDGRLRQEEFRLAIGLDWSSLSVDGSSVNSGAADGTRRSIRKRAASALGSKPTATDRIIPASTGYMDFGPAEAMFGQAAIEQLAAMNEALGAMNDQFAGLLGFGVEAFRLAEVEVTPHGGPIPYDNEVLEVLREFTVATNRKLPVGATGTFEASIFGLDHNRPGIFLITPIGETATLTVLENSRGAFRARFQGRVCEMDANAARAGTPGKCEPFHTISGEISKPFAYLYQVDNELVSHQTEGEKLYNKYMVARSSPGGASASGTGSAGTSPGTSAAASSGTTAGGSLQCNCSCPGQGSPQTTQCQAQCAPQLAMCQTPQASPAKPPTPTLAAQTKWFSRLVSGQGLSPASEQMLVDDFATMSAETRAYLIKKYRNGVP